MTSSSFKLSRTIENEIYIPSLALLFGTIGLILSLIANFNCRYITNQVIFSEQVDGNNITTSPYTFTSGLWNFEDHNLFYVVQSQSITLVRYHYCIPWSSAQTNVDQDGYWITSKVFSVISVVVGGFVGLYTCCFLCTSSATTAPRRVIMSLGWLYLFIMVCQGLTFLFLHSNVCTSSGGGTAKHGDQEFELKWTIADGDNGGGCMLASGANCSIASIVFYFCSSMIIFGSCCRVSNSEPTSAMNTRTVREQRGCHGQGGEWIGRGGDETRRQEEGNGDVLETKEELHHL